MRVSRATFYTLAAMTALGLVRSAQAEASEQPIVQGTWGGVPDVDVLTKTDDSQPRSPQAVPSFSPQPHRLQVSAQADRLHVIAEVSAVVPEMLPVEQRPVLNRPDSAGLMAGSSGSSPHPESALLASGAESFTHPATASTSAIAPSRSSSPEFASEMTIASFISEPQPAVAKGSGGSQATRVAEAAQSARLPRSPILSSASGRLDIRTDAVAMPEFATVQSLTPDPVSPVQQVAQAESSFPDIAGHWSQPFVEALALRGYVSGFPDGLYRPDAPVTRAEFAALIRQAFDQPVVRGTAAFSDVSPDDWAYEAIQSAYQMGFLSGFPDGTFAPELLIPRTQSLIALVSGLELTSDQPTEALLEQYFQDEGQIPGYARNQIAAATENRVVVNYPNPQLLQPNQAATRADVAAFIYQALVTLDELPPLPDTVVAAQYIVGPSDEVAVTPTPDTESPEPDLSDIPSQAEIDALQADLEALEDAEFGDIYRGSPAIVISNPMGFGADNNTVFLGGTFQADVRGSEEADGAAVIGVGLGDAQELIGAELSYTLASFGNNRDFGTGGFNAKLHRMIGRDTSVAVGWDGFITTGEDEDLIDFEDSVYGVVSHIVRTRPRLDSAFSRVALTAGLGTGRFQTIDNLEEDEDTINVFGSVAVRIAQPISFITEWTGQDLAMGLSIVPFPDLPFVITPAVRDLAGDGVDEARFVLGAGLSFQF